MRAVRAFLVFAVAGVMAALGTGTGAAALPDEPQTMAALGDSITRGHNACGWFFDCVDRSWSTGSSDRVDSHRRRLAATTPDALTDVFNNAVTGARAADLERQAELAVEQGADYVTILIGTGDVCAATEAEMTPVDRFGADITAGLDVLSQADTHVFVASVPDVIRLWQVGGGSAEVRDTWESTAVCPTALDRADSTDPADRERRARVAQRVDAYNDRLAAACGGYDGVCVYDAGAVHDHPFSLDHFSAWDYFHFNRSGQAVLADITWRSMLPQP